MGQGSASRFSFIRWSIVHSERTIVLIGSLLIAALSVTSAISIERSYEQALAQTGAELGTVAKVLAAQTQRAFEGIQLAQTGIADSLVAKGATTEATFGEVGRSRPVYDLLRGRKEALPVVDAFMIVSTKGELLNMSREWPTIGIDASDREYIKAFQRDPTLQTYLSEPLKARGSGSWSVFIARKVNGGEGKGIGIVLAAIRLSHFENFYSTLGLPGDAAVALFRRDGVLLARYPHVDPVIGGSIAGDRKLFTSMRDNSASVVSRQVGYIDHKDRIFAGHALERFPVVVTVSHSVEAVTAGWMRDVIPLAVSTLLTDLIAATAAFLGIRLIRQANRLARLDPVAKVPNRIHFHETLAMAFIRRPRRRFALLVLDLDQFKSVNDSLGHQAGDVLLRDAARRIRSVLDTPDMLVRLGGDEFAILTYVDGHKDAEALATKVIAAFLPSFDIAGRSLFVGISIGVAVAPDVGGDPDALYRDADLALYRAKSDCRGTYRLFAPEMAEQRSAQKARVRDLRTAMDTGQIHLAFQPLVDLRTGAVRAFEALARWDHPVDGAIPPSTFIPLAEDSGLIGPLGSWVLEQACQEAVRWPDDIKVAVNVSAVQFRIGDVFADVWTSLSNSGLAPRRLEIEITESVQIAENEDIGDTLLRIRALGVRISLDDFGTGYSSLSYLRSFPFDKIKIDQSFVADLLTSPGSAAIVETTLSLARRLGMDITAEGVETQEQLAALQELGCTEAQGYYLSRPVRSEHVASVLAKLARELAYAG